MQLFKFFLLKNKYYKITSQYQNISKLKKLKKKIKNKKS